MSILTRKRDTYSPDDRESCKRLFDRLDLLPFDKLRDVLAGFCANAARKHPDCAGLYLRISEAERVIRKTLDDDEKSRVHYALHSFVYDIHGSEFHSALIDAVNYKGVRP